MKKAVKENTKEKVYEQLSLVQRAQLQASLKTHKSLSSIAKEMGVSRQTLYRELIRNSYPVNKDTCDTKSSCLHIQECRRGRTKLKLFCPYNCAKYNPGRQKCLKKYPFVCNNCAKKARCTYLQYYYDAEKASREYHHRIENANSKPRADEKTLKTVNKTVSPLIKKGQSVEAILMNHPEIKISASTLRYWIKLGALDCHLSDLRMTGRRLPTNRTYVIKEDAEEHQRYDFKENHKYQDYLLYHQYNQESLIIELDTVIGCIDGVKSVLTIHIVQHRLQFGILLESHTKKEVYEKLKEFMDKLKAYDDMYGTIMNRSFCEILLTDNGVEFDSLLDLEESIGNCHVFYCRPYASYQKGACERNHVLVRFIHYKGWSFDGLTQEDINMLFSHINSYPRKSLGGKTPYEKVLEDSRLGQTFLDFAGIKKVDCDDVTLNPSLLKKIKK